MTTVEKLTTTAYNTVKIAEYQKSLGVEEGKQEGKQAEYDRFWDAYQQNGNRDEYNCGFGGKGWTADNFKPKYSVTNIWGAYMMFGHCGFDGDLDDAFKNRGLTLDFKGTRSMEYLFYNSSIKAVGTVDMSGYTGTVASVFNSPTIETIRNLIPPSVALTTTCWGAGLVNLGIGGYITHDISLSRCTKLSHASITDVINHLSMTASGCALTLSQAAVNKAFETAEGANDGSTSAEWLELAFVGTQLNWNISLV